MTTSRIFATALIISASLMLAIGVMDGMSIFAIIAMVMFVLAAVIGLRRRPTAAPYVGDGPLMEVPPKAFPLRKKIKGLKTAVWIFGGLTLLTVILLPDSSDAGGLLVALFGFVANSLVLVIWMSRRGDYRVDATGFHRRGLLSEQTIRWREITSLGAGESTIRRAGGLNTSLPTFQVHSKNLVLWFPQTLAGASELACIIEGATGLEFPRQLQVEPEYRSSSRVHVGLQTVDPASVRSSG